MNFKKIISLLLSLVMVFSLVACGGKKTNEDKKGESTKEVTKTEAKIIGMVTDEGGVEDKSFNQSSWEGLQKFSKDSGVEVSYVHSQQKSDYNGNLNGYVDKKASLIWGIGYNLSNSIKEVALQSPKSNFAIIDFPNAFEEKGKDKPVVVPNLTGVLFSSQEAGYLVGYIAGHTTKTNKVGAIGGMEIPSVTSFIWGYKAGVQDAAKELSKKIEVVVEYAGGFTDIAQGKAMAKKMYSNGIDIIFQVAGGLGKGVIETAKEMNKFVIGADKDQSEEAPDNVLTSAMKRVDVAIYDISKRVLAGEKLGGQTIVYSAKENGVAIPEHHKLYSDELHAKAMAKLDEIKDGKIVPPYDEATFAKYGK